MEDRGKSGLHMVETNWDEIERKVRDHRLKQLRIVAVIVGVCVAIGIFSYIYMQRKTYDDFRIVDQTAGMDAAAMHFEEYNGYILRYSNDGASCIDINNRMIWNQGFEMQNPMISICGEYVAFADRQGKEIYLLNGEGPVGKIDVNMPLMKVETSARGTVAAWMKDQGVSYVSVYNSDGEALVEGALHIENSGVPLDLAVSPDGQKLAVSILDVSEGLARTSIHFYDFGSAGQNVVDHMVAEFSYSDTIIPDITYVDNDRALAFADNAIYSYSGGDKPQEAQKMEIDGQIQSVFYRNGYFGVAFAAEEDRSVRRIGIYNTNCQEVIQIQTDLSYQKIQFLDNNEICMYSEQECAIYTLGGLKKFHYDFGKTICGIMHNSGYRDYTFLMENEIDRVRLKLFGRLTGEVEHAIQTIEGAIDQVKDESKNDTSKEGAQQKQQETAPEDTTGEGT